MTVAEVYFKQMTPFFRAMAHAMAKAHKEKGASWKTCSIGYLLDRASNQFEDLGNRPGEEDYMANLANYAYMLWRHEQAAQNKLPLDFEEAEGVEIKIPLENLELIRCYQCEHFKPIGRGTSGWCQDAKPKIRVQAVDFCDEAEKKEAEGHA